MLMSSPTSTTFLSRERLAGYDPERLSAARVLVVGAGALGQNVLLNLALSGVGTLLIVDPDVFEAHNRTRSPFFPIEDGDRERFNLRKAATVAHAALALATAPEAVVFFHDGFVEGFGQGVFRLVDVVIACVDSNAARAYLAEQCRRFGVPLVEAGFEAQHVSLAVFRNREESEPCWRCSRPIVAEGNGLSCAAYARRAEEEGIVPAIQAAAAVLGGLQAEAAIQALHDQFPLGGRRFYLDVRTGRAQVVALAQNPDCPGVHAPLTGEVVPVELADSATLADLLAGVSRILLEPVIRLPFPFVVSAPCARCGRPVEIGKPAWAVRAAPVCPESCGAASGFESAPPVTFEEISSAAEPAFLALSCARAGLGPLSAFEAWAAHSVVGELAGSLDSTFSRAGSRRGVEGDEDRGTEARVLARSV